MSGSLFLLGVVALIQAAFLPGYLLLRALGIRKNMLSTTIWAFALSVLLNHVLICVLTVGKIYTRKVILALLLAELVGLIIVCWRAPRRSEESEDEKLLAGLLDAWRSAGPITRLVTSLLAIAALGCIWNVLGTGLHLGWDGAFTFGDTTVSWNRWALDWASNRLPRITWHYPQLVPSISSLSYVICGTTPTPPALMSGVPPFPMVEQTTIIHAFSRILMWFFPTGILLIGLDLAIRVRHSGFLVGIIVSSVAMWDIATCDLGSGYADIPLAFMVLAALYGLLLAQEQTVWRDKLRWLILSGCIVGGAALTKQGGLFLVVTFPVLAWAMVLHETPVRRSTKLAWLGVAVACCVVIACPWYTYKQIQISQHNDVSEVLGINATQHGGSIDQRVAMAAHLVQLRYGGAVLAFVGVGLLAAAVAEKRWRWITLVFIPAGLFGWAITTNYDMRNVVFVIPLAAIGAGLGIWALRRPLRQWTRNWPSGARMAAVTVLGGVVVLAIARHPSLSRGVIEYYQMVACRQAGTAQLNSAIYDLQAQGKMDGSVLTNYQVFWMLPWLNASGIFDPLTDADSIRRKLALYHPKYIAACGGTPNFSVEFASLDGYAKSPGGLQRVSMVAQGVTYRVFEIHYPPSRNADGVVFGGFTVIEGLCDQEGPYPQQHLPVVRWGLGPATKLEFEGNPLKPNVLVMDYVDPDPKQSVRIMLNGQLIGECKLADQLDSTELTFDLPAHAGPNQLEIQYSKSLHPEVPDGRMLALLYRRLLIISK